VSALSGFEDRMKVEIYEQLFRLNQGYDEVLTALAALRRHPAFPASELDRFTAVSKEARASTNSYLAAILEAAETADAGRRYQKRLARKGKTMRRREGLRRLRSR
jgi:hypothetical protein